LKYARNYATSRATDAANAIDATTKTQGTKDRSGVYSCVLAYSDKN